VVSFNPSTSDPLIIIDLQYESLPCCFLPQIQHQSMQEQPRSARHCGVFQPFNIQLLITNLDLQYESLPYYCFQVPQKLTVMQEQPRSARHCGVFQPFNIQLLIISLDLQYESLPYCFQVPQKLTALQEQPRSARHCGVFQPFNFQPRRSTI